MLLQSQLALLTIQASRQLLFVPDLLVPEGWSTATLEQPCMLYKVAYSSILFTVLSHIHMANTCCPAGCCCYRQHTCLNLRWRHTVQAGANLACKEGGCCLAAFECLLLCFPNLAAGSHTGAGF